MMGLDTSIGGLERRGDQIILSAAGADPRFANGAKRAIRMRYPL